MTPPSLIERLSDATVGSIELDCDISIQLGEWSPPKNAVRDGDRPDVWRRNGIKYYHPYTEVTTSLDAALALAERVLPGCFPGVQKNRWTIHEGPEWSAFITPSDANGEVECDAPTPALALCIAILKATEGAK